MKRYNSFWIVWGIAIIVFWVCFGIIPFCIPTISNHRINLLLVSYTAATALFTGVAFFVACLSLYKQQENLKEQQRNIIKQQDSLSKQIDLNVLSVFMDTLKYITNSKSFKLCQNYIISEDFFNDREIIRTHLKKSKGEDISLDDYGVVLDKDEMYASINEKERIRLRQNRDKIKNYCMRMEYVGTVVLNLKDKTAEKMLLDVYGHIIIKTYNNRLGPLINGNKSEEKYEHYVELFNIAQKMYNK